MEIERWKVDGMFVCSWHGSTTHNSMSICTLNPSISQTQQSLLFLLIFLLYISSIILYLFISFLLFLQQSFKFEGFITSHHDPQKPLLPLLSPISSPPFFLFTLFLVQGSRQSLAFLSFIFGLFFHVMYH